MNINLHIEMLALDGVVFDPLQRDSLQVALEADLNKLLARIETKSSLQNGGAVGRVTAESIGLGRQNDAAHLSEQIAQSIYGSMFR